VPGQRALPEWLAARSAELLPVPYFHIVFTLPHELSALILQNKRLLYDLLFRTSSASLLELARDPKHLGADIGFLGVLHTWGQNLQVHPHVHYIVPAGGLALDGSRWIDSSRRFFLPVKALSKVFCGKFCEELRELFIQDRLQFHNAQQQLASPGAFSRFLWQLGQKDWSASDTSASSPTEEGKPPSHAAASCSALLRPQIAPKQPTCCAVPHAPAPCWSSNGSRVLNFTSGQT
jgi:hypothetical protein